MSKKGYRTGKFEETDITLSLRGIAFSRFEFRIMSRELSEHGRKRERHSKNCVAHVWIIP